MNPIFVAALAASLTFGLPTFAQAAGSHAHGQGHGHGPNIGKPGDAAKAARTITIVMKDNFYEPEEITVAKGETVRFVVVNQGDFVHEFNIGTADTHAAHQKEMAMMFEHGVLEVDKINYAMMKMEMKDAQGKVTTMEHNDPNSALIEPGKDAEIVWTFSTDAKLEFACNVPGHYDSGMVGPIAITSK